MRASALTLFAAGALAAPSILKHQHRHARRQAVEYTTCTEEDIVTKYVTAGAPQPTVQDSSAAAASSESSLSNAFVTSLPVAAAEYTDAPKLATSSAPVVVPSVVQSSAPVVVPSVAQSSATPAASSIAQASSAVVASSYVAPVSSAAPPSSSAAAPSSSVTAASSAPAATSSSASSSAPGTYPFKNIVIFGDNLSDRGNGSSDHNLAGDPETIYGFKTWTDGKIAAEQLSDNMDLPIVYDFAYGHSDGGSKFGATIDNILTMSDAKVPSVREQIQNYTTGGFYDQAKCGETLHFVWGGNNDMIPWEKTPGYHVFPDATAGNGLSNPTNVKFCTDLANAITTQVKTLSDKGAEHIFVPNVYPRHIAPVVQRYFSNDTTWVENYGKLISQVNSNLESNLQQLAQSTGKKIVYYDAYTFLMDTYNAAVQSGANGINMMKPGQNICDGAFIDPVPGVKSLAYCAQGNNGDKFYWMQYLDMTAHVHGLLAQDMQKAIQTAYA